MKEIYLDNNATTRVDERVFEEMRPYFCELYGNPSSMHFFGGQVQKKVDEARSRVAALLGALPDEIVFTACGTESDNAAIRSALEVFPEKRHIITSRVEHPAVLTQCRNLTKRGYRVTELNVDGNGQLDLKELEAALDDDTVIVSLMYANNETGVIFPIEEAAKMVKAKGALFHTDAVQAVGKIPLNMAESAIDLLSLSGHKLHAPKGVGVLYVRRGTPFRPLLVGGHQERGRRAGTENTASIIAMGKACELAHLHMPEEAGRVREMRDRLERELTALIPNTRINGGGTNRLPNTLSIAMEFVEGEGILLLLSEKGICASSGSACTSGSLEPSHVLRAMGVPFTCAHGSIRFSLSRFTTDAEIDAVIKELPPIISRLRQMSPFGREFLNK
ncbi:nitrogen fixation iron-sulfur cluster assembly cysteine desulfurase NifS [Citrifermentans bemidjiense Bem]|uniref:Cysteine desulfurase n=1 Tax=Citrifermentans bemidjiense (strain ATCC BAA-1014 / DSM 16622 / JCM 12645 / Bem) TaxID=404380 RepID=B5E8K2_CITBB|nr:cysteine desulfurase NifS [Citrifermentans bemidjiense]ACH38587.1 nitrogen fixation iron-sulfur cluster assembly cysteine desulfurase NifS [Citrifermentans bemidjiense Bem]